MFQRIFLSIAFYLCAAFTGWAHDPGLSSAKLILGDDSLRATLTFAPADIEAISSSGDVGPLSAPLSPKVQGELESLARQSLEVKFDGQKATASQATVQLLPNNNLEFQVSYPGIAKSQLEVRSKLLDRLPFGHRQYFSLDDTKGRTLQEKLLSAAGDSVTVAVATPTPVPSHRFSEFLVLGIKHILTGYDHLLFLFALLIGCRRFSSVIKIITAFTVAHSISLALATLGIVQIPSRIIEPMIAASIVYVGIENLLHRQSVSNRVWLTFGFGLVHGFGFASVLREMGVGASGSAIAVPLIAFNSGVEIGQMMVASLVLPILWHFKDKPQFTVRWAPACSILVVILGGYWFVERVWFT